MKPAGLRRCDEASAARGCNRWPVGARETKATEGCNHLAAAATISKRKKSQFLPETSSTAPFLLLFLLLLPPAPLGRGLVGVMLESEVEKGSRFAYLTALFAHRVVVAR
jgi:hypothetical protein